MASIRQKHSFQAIVLVLTVVFCLLTLFRMLFKMMTNPTTWYKNKDRSGDYAGVTCKKSGCYRFGVYPSCLLDPSLGSHEYMTANGIKFHYVVKGARTKPLMLLLHGFPEFWFSWRHQIREFSEDYRVVAIDMRGYGDTQRPPNRTDYTMDKLTQDIIVLIENLGYAKCTLVAHDWGGVVGWRVAHRHPEYVDNYIVMNCPHPKVYANAVSKSCTQILKSWYIFMFQVPKLPELSWSLNDYEALEHVFTKHPGGTITKDAFPPDILEAYKYTFSRPGALTAPINYYRCMMKSGNDQTPKKKEGPKKNSVPTLLIWGDNDIYLDKSMADEHTKLVNSIQIKHIPDCSHWVQNDKPALVNQYMREFLEQQELEQGSTSI